MKVTMSDLIYLNNALNKLAQGELNISFPSTGSIVLTYQTLKPRWTVTYQVDKAMLDLVGDDASIHRAGQMLLNEVTRHADNLRGPG